MPTLADVIHRPVRAAVVVLSVLVVAGTGCRKDTTGPATTGGTMVVVVPAEPATLFPPRATQSQELAVVSAVFDRLADIGPALNTIGDVGFTPRLATRWTWSADSLSIAFALDPKARWHDGAPVRAEDVRFTFHAYTADAVASEARSLLANIDSVSVRDSLTAVVWFKRRSPQQFMDATYSMFILPAHLLAALPDTALAQAPFGRQPVGTGRFRFVAWESGSRLTVTADTGNARGRARLDRVIWTFVPDLAAATVQLLAGDADFLEQVRPEAAAQVAQAPALRLESNLPLIYGFVGYNLRARRGTAPHPVLGDVRVRRALSMAVDRAQVVRTVLDTMGLVAFGPAPRVLIPDTAALRPLATDLAAARALLDSAGWVDRNGDGIRERNGVRLAFELLAPSSSPTRTKLSVLLQGAMKQVGADVTLQTLDPSAMGQRVDGHDFDAYMGGFQTNPGLQGMRQTWTTGGSANYQGYASPVFDALLDSALTTFSAAKSHAYWTRAFQAAIDDVPSLWLYEQRFPVAVHRRLRIPQLRADGWYTNLADWSIDPAQAIARDRTPASTPTGAPR